MEAFTRKEEDGSGAGKRRHSILVAFVSPLERGSDEFYKLAASALISSKEAPLRSFPSRMAYLTKSRELESHFSY